MSSIKISAGLLAKLERLQEPVSKQEMDKLGSEMVSQMKELIASGQSTVRGGGYKGRMPAYKRANDKDGYPNNVKGHYPDKQKRPVNLFLTGQMLSSLKHRIKKGSLEIGYFNSKAAKKETGHREGVNSQPSRPTIPDVGGNENFAASVIKIFNDYLTKKIKSLTK